MKKIKVVHLSTCHIPFDGRIFHRECISLSRAGFDVSLLAYHIKNEQREGVEIISLGVPVRNKPSLQLLARHKRSKRAGEMAQLLSADIYQIHDIELIPAALRLKHQTGARVIYDCHEDNVAFMLQKRHVPKLLRWGMSRAVRWLEWRAAQQLDAIITADPGVQTRFVTWGARTEVLYNFPSLDFFPTLLELPEPTVDLVYHGSIPRYHLEMVFRIDDELLRRGRKARWLMFGQFHDIQWARQQVEVRGATDRIIMGERIPAEQVAPKVRQARIGIVPLPDLPKFQNNIPTKLFEFMALGMPVVLSDLPASRPFVSDGRCALAVQPDNPEAYANAIIRLMDDPALCARMGKEGRRRIESEHNWKSQEEKLVALYTQLLQK